MARDVGKKLCSKANFNMDNGKSDSETEADLTKREVVTLSSSSSSDVDKVSNAPSPSSSSSFLPLECSEPTTPPYSDVEPISDVEVQEETEECSQSEGRRVTRSRVNSSASALSRTGRITRSMTSTLSTENASVSVANTHQKSKYNLRASQAKRDNCKKAYSTSGEKTVKDSSAKDSDSFFLPIPSTSEGKKTRTTVSTSDSEDERKCTKPTKKKVIRKKQKKMAAKVKPIPIVTLCESDSDSSSLFEKIEATCPKEKPVKQGIPTESSDNNGDVDFELDVDLEPLNFSNEIPPDDGNTHTGDDLCSLENLNPTVGLLVDENGSTDWMNQLLEPDFIADALDQPFDEDFFRAFGCEDKETN